MAFLSTINIIGSALTAEHTRLDVISENITNMNTTRTEAGGAYRRKIVTFEAQGDKSDFRMMFERAKRRPPQVVYGGGYASLVRRPPSNRGWETAGGVRIAELGEDETEMPFVFDPTHPDANDEGYVEMPNVTLVKEITDAMAASQHFNANVTAFNTYKSTISSGLEISI